MTLMTDNYLPDEQLEKIAGALNNGLIVVDLNGRIVWIDENTRQTINGGLQELAFPLAQHEHLALDCFLSPVEVTVNGQRKTLCVIQQTAEQRETSSDFIAAIEAVLSDSSWFTRTIVEKLKAWRQAKQPSTRPSDLDLLTDREREILALICEGRSDAEMSRMLRLSQNTVRNHVASLYRKIGVNRRSAAIIWARERAITSYEFAASGARPRRRDRHA
jgi:DNA-binding CsgD family transcriptional regulator